MIGRVAPPGVTESQIYIIDKAASISKESFGESSRAWPSSARLGGPGGRSRRGLGRATGRGIAADRRRAGDRSDRLGDRPPVGVSAITRERPAGLPVHDGRSVQHRPVLGGAFAMRAGPLSSPQVIDLLNARFVPVFAVIEDYRKGGDAPTRRRPCTTASIARRWGRASRPGRSTPTSSTPRDTPSTRSTSPRRRRPIGWWRCLSGRPRASRRPGTASPWSSPGACRPRRRP